MGDLSDHFDSSEFACQGKNCCGNTSVAHVNLVVGLEALRRLVNQRLRVKRGKSSPEVPLVVTSGFRCNRHNEKIGGAPHSEHTNGTAADVKIPPGMGINEFYELVCQVPVFHEGGIGVYWTHIHVDVRKQRARWDNRFREDSPLWGGQA